MSKPWYTNLLTAPQIRHYSELMKNGQIYYGYRTIVDNAKRRCISIESNVSNGKENPIPGLISPVEADILGKVISAYVESDQFKADWRRIALDHFQ